MGTKTIRGINVKLKILLSVLALVFSSSMVLAGLVQPAPLLIQFQADGSGFAQGDMTTVRFSENDINVIGCGIRTLDIGGGVIIEFGFCQATLDDGSAEGLRGFCSTENSDLLDTMRASNYNSFVTFSWNAAEECTRIGYSTQSFYITKGKDKDK